MSAQLSASTIWCGPSGCQKGLEITMDREFGNPFGGLIGRREPIFVSQHTLLDSPDVDILAGMLNASNGKSMALSADAEIRALVEAADSRGAIMQIRFLGSETLRPVKSLSQDSQTSIPLPPFNQAAIAHLSEGSQQIAALLLAYDNSDQATAGARALYNRLSQWTEVNGDKTYVELIIDGGGALQSPETYHSLLTDSYVSMILISYQPQPLESGLSQTNAPEMYSFVSRWLINRFQGIFASDRP